MKKENDSKFQRTQTHTLKCPTQDWWALILYKQFSQKVGMGTHLFLNTPNSLLLGSSTTILSALNEWLIFCCVNMTLEWIFGGPKTPLAPPSNLSMWADAQCILQEWPCKGGGQWFVI